MFARRREEEEKQAAEEAARLAAEEEKKRRLEEGEGSEGGDGQYYHLCYYLTLTLLSTCPTQYMPSCLLYDVTCVEVVNVFTGSTVL